MRFRTAYMSYLIGASPAVRSHRAALSKHPRQTKAKTEPLENRPPEGLFIPPEFRPPEHHRRHHEPTIDQCPRNGREGRDQSVGRCQSSGPKH